MNGFFSHWSLAFLKKLSHRDVLVRIVSCFMLNNDIREKPLLCLSSFNHMSNIINRVPFSFSLWKNKLNQHILSHTSTHIWYFHVLKRETKSNRNRTILAIESLTSAKAIIHTCNWHLPNPLSSLQLYKQFLELLAWWNSFALIFAFSVKHLYL